MVDSQTDPPVSPLQERAQDELVWLDIEQNHRCDHLCSTEDAHWHTAVATSAKRRHELVRDFAASHAALVAALKEVDEFIRNGIEFKFIRMPDAGSDDRALLVPGIVKAALKLATADPSQGVRQEDK